MPSEKQPWYTRAAALLKLPAWEDGQEHDHCEDDQTELHALLAEALRERDELLRDSHQLKRYADTAKQSEIMSERKRDAALARATAAEERVAELEYSVASLQSILANEEAVTSKLAAAAERAAIKLYARQEAERLGMVLKDDRAWETLHDFADRLEALAHHPAPTTHATGDGDE